MTKRDSDRRFSRVEMNWDDPEYLEAIRLIRKFFPESKPIASTTLGLHWEPFLQAMGQCDCYHDTSCDPYCLETTAEMTLAQNGGTDGPEAEVYTRLLNHTGFSPTGRVVVIPETLHAGGWLLEERRPFVCHSRTLPERLADIDQHHPERYLFTGCSDTLLVYESGEALLVNHDERFFWARSKIRSQRS